MINAVAVLAMLASLTSAMRQNHELRRAEDLSTDTTLGTLQWVGPLYPGAPKTSLTGTAKSIYEQIRGLNPNYNPWDFDDFRADMKAKGITKDVYESDFRTKTITPTSPNPAAAAALNLATREDYPWFDCRAGPESVWWGHCDEGRAYMRGLGAGQAECLVEPGQCTRFSCSWDCGIFFCSRNNQRVQIKCSNIIDDIEEIQRQCKAKNHNDIKGRKVFHGYYTEVSWSDC